ncbi:MAG: outer membrane beta-barrel protein [Chitinophagales bacterium]|nr:outer membrane beta-barrel protein [Chitinophagales bacterium]
MKLPINIAHLINKTTHHEKHLLFLCILSIVNFAAAQSTESSTAVKANKSKDGFWHHSGEIAITPSADYFIYGKGKDFEKSEPYEFQLPFIGFNISGQYMYRPVEVFAVSAGLGFRMQGNFYRQTDYFFGKKYVSIRSNGHTGYLSVPLEFHLFKKLPGCTFEFATGPQFNFPVNTRSGVATFDADGDKINSGKDKDNFTTTQMREGASLGWNLLLGGEVHLAKHADLFIGPQINFVNLAFFDKDRQEARTDFGDNFDCSLGLKLGFRIHCEE